MYFPFRFNKGWGGINEFENKNELGTYKIEPDGFLISFGRR